MMVSAEHDQALMERAAAMRRDAGMVLADLRLPERFEPLGQPILIGSTSFGLSLARDIDIGTLCPVLETGPIWDALRPLADHPRVKRLRWTDERASFNSTGEPSDEGIYCGLHYFRDGYDEGERWKIDCWFFPEDASRPELPLRDRLLAATSEQRLAILRLKDAAMQEGRYGPSGDIHGILVYEAVLDHGVRRYGDLATLREA